MLIEVGNWQGLLGIGLYLKGEVGPALDVFFGEDRPDSQSDVAG